jgi:hypothetical protein
MGLSIRYAQRRGGWEGLVALRSFSLWENKLQLLISIQMHPLWSLYEYTFHKNHKCPQSNT